MTPHSSLLLYCNDGNQQIIIHHRILVHFAYLLLQASWELSCEFAIVQIHFAIEVGGYHPVLPLFLEEKL